MQAFDYVAPSSVQEAVAVLAKQIALHAAAQAFIETSQQAAAHPRALQIRFMTNAPFRGLRGSVAASANAA
jgi:hypothetical protein